MRRRPVLWLFLVVLVLGTCTFGASTSAAEGSFRFAAAGDFGVAPASAGALFDSLGQSGVQAFFALGDLSYGGPGSEAPWCDFVKSRLPEAFPVEVLAGNHESNGQDGEINNFSACLSNQLQGLVGTYGREYYVDAPRDGALVRFIMVSPALTFADGGTWSYAPGTAHYAWLEATIDDARADGVPWVVVGMHKPCLTMAARGCEVGADLADLLVAKRVDLVLTGHEHHYVRTAQLRLQAGCPGLTLNGFEASCVHDADNDLVAGQGTVFVTVGTGGTGQYTVETEDSEAGYFVAWGGGPANPTYGYSDIAVDENTMRVTFQRVAGAPFSDAFTLTRSTGPPPANEPPVAAFTATDSSPLEVSFDAADSVDPDGIIVGYAWDFGDGQSGSGRTAVHAYAAAETYVVTLTVTDEDGGVGQTTRQVVVPQPPTGHEVVADTFERVVTNGWGAAEVGGTWTPSTTSAGIFSVSGGAGRVNLRTAGVGPSVYLGGVSAADVDVTAVFSYDKVPSGSSTQLETAVLLRRLATGQYRTVVRLLPTGAVQVRMVRVASGQGTAGIGSTVSLPGVTYVAGDQLRVRTQAIGTNPTTLRARVWIAGTPEPSTWQVSGQDSTAVLQTGGSPGLLTYLAGGATNVPIQASYDEFRVLTP